MLDIKFDNICNDNYFSKRRRKSAVAKNYHCGEVDGAESFILYVSIEHTGLHHYCLHARVFTTGYMSDMVRSSWFAVLACKATCFRLYSMMVNECTIPRIRCRPRRPNFSPMGIVSSTAAGNNASSGHHPYFIYINIDITTTIAASSLRRPQYLIRISHFVNARSTLCSHH